MKRDSWWGRQLQREDLLTTLEQGRRVEVELFQEKHRGLRTMGELLKARLFGSTQWAIDLRDRMLKFRGGGVAATGTPVSRHRPPEPHPDLDCEALPGRPWLDFAPEPLIGRLKIPARYRKDESDV
jgi:hypothetical protein